MIIECGVAVDGNNVIAGETFGRFYPDRLKFRLGKSLNKSVGQYVASATGEKYSVWYAPTFYRVGFELLGNPVHRSN